MANRKDSKTRDRDREIVARIGRHTWRVACAPGDESALIDALLAHANSNDSPLTWIDAAALFCRIGRPSKSEIHTPGPHAHKAGDSDSSRRDSAECMRSTKTP